MYRPADDIGSLARYVNDPAAEERLDDVRRFVRERLPDYMVPAAFVHMADLPVTVHGKLDRRALPAPEVATRSEGYIAPTTDTERALARVFADVLGVDRVGTQDSFFALGGDSIMSIQLVARAKAEGLVLSPRDVFEHKTIAALAAAVTLAGPAAPTLEELPGGGVGDVPLTPILRWLVGSGRTYPGFCQSVSVPLPDRLREADLLAALQASWIGTTCCGRGFTRSPERLTSCISRHGPSDLSRRRRSCAASGSTTSRGPNSPRSPLPSMLPRPDGWIPAGE